MDLKGSATEQNLKDAFAGESQANRRYLYFASKADDPRRPPLTRSIGNVGLSVIRPRKRL